MQTEALFWAGKAKFDSRIGEVLRGGGGKSGRKTGQEEETRSLAPTMTNGVGTTRTGGEVVVGRREVVAVARASPAGREGWEKVSFLRCLVLFMMSGKERIKIDIHNTMCGRSSFKIQDEFRTHSLFLIHHILYPQPWPKLPRRRLARPILYNPHALYSVPLRSSGHVPLR